MKSFSDSVIGLTLILVLVGYFMLTQSQTARSEAILAEISQVMNDLEQELTRVESSKGYIPANIPLANLLRDARKTAVLTTSDDPALMPDIQETEGQTFVGGCPLSTGAYALLREDYVAMTGIPENWAQENLRLCLDRNGPNPPNREGYDVIWLSVSRLGSPHVTLIPVSSQVVQD